MAHKISRSPTEMIGEVEVYGDDFETFNDLLKEDVTLAFGRNKGDMKWNTESIKFGEFLNGYILPHAEAKKKDGKCFTQGALVSPRRLAKNVSTLDLIVLDMDTGQPIEEVRETLLQEGLFAIIYTTHSHLATTSDVPKDKLMKSLDLDDADDIDDGAVRRYFSSFKRYHKSVCDGMKFDRVEHVDGGIRVFVTHPPIPKYRILMFLSEPFDVATVAKNQTDAINRWKAKYAGLAELLGAAFDRSCVDPSRLFYLPTHKPGAEYHTEIILGDTVVLDDIKNGDPRGHKVSNAWLDAAGDVDDHDREEIENTWLWKTMKGRYNAFMGADFAASYGETVHYEEGDKTCCTCPFDENHSDPGNPDDRGFVAWNPDDKSFGMKCMHDGCAGITPMQFLDRMVSDNELSEEDLEDFFAEFEGAEEVDTEPDTEEDDPPFDTDEKADNSTAKVVAQSAKQSDIPAWEKDDFPADLEPFIKRFKKLKRNDDDSVTNLFEDLVDEEFSDLLMAFVYKVVNEATGFAVPDLRRKFKGMVAAARKAEAEEDDEHVYISIHDPFDTQVHGVKKALIRHNKKEPRLFRLDDGICRVTKTGEVRSYTGDARREILERDSLFTELNNTVYWYELAGDNKRQNRSTPQDVTTHYRGLSNREIPLPRLDRLAKHPIFTEDGKLHIKNGYDPESQAYLDLSFKPLPVSKDPSVAELDHAYDLIFEELLVDFPLRDRGEVQTNASRANMLAMMLQPFVRSIIGSGNTPLFLIEKPMPGAGSSLLGDLVSTILEGEIATKYQYKPNDEEVEKNIIAKLISSTDGIMFYDNVSEHTTVDSAVLASAITSSSYSGRVLGHSKTFTSPVRHIWLMSGNNIKFANEMLRRIVPITLLPEEVNPELRDAEDFKHPNVQAWTEDHRDELVWALCTIVQNWIADGMPDWKPSGRARVMGSFERWSNVIGGILQSFGMAGFLENIDNFKASNAVEADSNTTFLSDIKELTGGQPFTVKELFEKFWPEPGEGDFASEPIYEFPFNYRSRHGAKTTMGMHLRGLRNRKFYLFEETGERSHDALKYQIWIEEAGNERNGAKKFVLMTKASHNGPGRPHGTKADKRKAINGEDI